MEYSVKTPADVARMVENILVNTKEGKHEITVTLVIDSGEIKALTVG